MREVPCALSARDQLNRIVIQARRDLTVAYTWLPSLRAFGASFRSRTLHSRGVP